MVRAHGDGKQQRYEHNRVAKGDNRMSIQGRSQNRVGFDGNPLGSDAKPEGSVEPK